MPISPELTNNVVKDVLAIVQELIRELHASSRQKREITLDSSLEGDLSIDSLSRMELLARLERHFGVALSEQAVAAAETTRDLLYLVSANKFNVTNQKQFAAIEATISNDATKPEHATTLIEALRWHATHHPSQIHTHLYDDDHQLSTITYGDLYENAKKAAQGFVDSGVETGDTVAVMLPTTQNYFYIFLGIQMAGGIAVPIYPPSRVSQIEEHLSRHAKILENARAKILVTFHQVKSLALILRAKSRILEKILTPAEIISTTPLTSTPSITADTVALLQYTSGSTGDPRGVVLTHGDILSNVRVMDRALQTTPQDIFISWLPLYHDMGLIGAWIGSLYVGFTLVLMSPLSFLSRPHRWLHAIHQHRGTISGGPNFSYELCVSRIADEDLDGVDLSSWRIAFNGAEPVNANTLRRFTSRFQGFGFQSTAITPVYGLAEATLGLAFPPLNRGLHVDVISQETLTVKNRAEPAIRANQKVLEVVACGRPLPEYQVRIVDKFGREQPERHQGRIEFRGPSATRGYYRNPAATEELFNSGWLNSGDLGYIANGDIFITGRTKDVIIRAGRNIYPYTLEDAVSNLPSVRKGCVAVFGSNDPTNQTEKLILVAETRDEDHNTSVKLEQVIGKLAIDLLGIPLDDINLVPPGTILKTSSGKIRRAATRERYDAGTLLSARDRHVKIQIIRLLAGAISPQFFRMWHSIGRLAFASWLWLLLAACGVISALGVVLLPSLRLRWSLIRFMTRLLHQLAALPVEVSGLENLPRGQPFVLVSNHQSYMDAPVLSGVLPVVVSYIAKSELKSHPVIKRLLTRLGVCFVERFNNQQSVADARAIDAVIAKGNPVVFFAEGTFKRTPGLLPFQMGAFLCAANNNVPIVPVTLRGTRFVLRDGSWFPRYGGIRVIFSSPIPVEFSENAWHTAIRLRDQTRAVILHWSTEPDLLQTYGTHITQPNNSSKQRS